MTDSNSPLLPARDGRLTPEGIAERSFSMVKRGYSESEVRAFLRRVADEVSGLVGRERDLSYRMGQLEEAASQPPPALTDQQLITALGEETARVLGQAREAAIELRNKAEDHARRVVREAQEQVRGLRTSAQQAIETRTREAEDSARTRAAEIVGEARTMRERVLSDLSERRQELERQINDLRAGRGKLVDAYETVERALGQVTQLMAQETPLRAAPTPAPEPEASAADSGDDDEAPPEEPAVAEPPPVEAPAAVAEAPASTATADAPARETDTAAPGSHDVGALFEQLRSRSSAGADDAALGFTEASTTPGAGEGAPEAAATAEEAVVAPELEPDEDRSPDEQLLDAREDALAPIAEDLTRRAKRALQDEQNDVLDGVRRQRGKIDTAKVLPALDDQLARWAHVLQPAVDKTYVVGAASAGGDAQRAPAAVLADLASVVVTPLRERLSATLADIDEPTPADTELAIAQRLGARYREWRSQHLETMLGDVLAAAHAHGVFDAAREGAQLRWIPIQTGKCADCDDNALEPTLRGNDFPTGQPHPPAHPGCRCLLVVDSTS
jgi:DivIVA domain-containing protein